MARHIRHVYAGPNEWVRVHRRGGDDSGWVWLIVLGLFVLFCGGC
jgi:hypothetical protein